MAAHRNYALNYIRLFLALPLFISSMNMNIPLLSIHFNCGGCLGNLAPKTKSVTVMRGKRMGTSALRVIVDWLWHTLYNATFLDVVFLSNNTVFSIVLYLYYYKYLLLFSHHTMLADIDQATLAWLIVWAMKQETVWYIKH